LVDGVKECVEKGREKANEGEKEGEKEKEKKGTDELGGKGDSSYGEILFDLDALEETMTDYRPG
jgi:hypothetical protein